VPVLSYLLLRGRCRNCKVHISARYPAVEALTGALWVFVAWRDGFTWALPFDLVFVTLILVLIFIDAEQLLLPNAITYPGLVFSLIARVTLPYLIGRTYFNDPGILLNSALAGLPLWAASLVGALIGALVGGGALWLMAWIWERLRGVELIGLGNVKLMLMVGAYLGWRLTILNIFLSVLFVIVIVPLLWLQRGNRDMRMLLPSGVFLGLGAVISLFFGSQILNWYTGFYR
jgi:leader peptidase (prepilin peptidase)/N-methyltransferase